FRDREIVDRGEPKSHETVRIELPVFISIRAKPMTGIVMPLISKPYSDTIPGKRPEFLDEPVIQFFGPFRFKNWMISCRPFGNSARFLQRESIAYANATFSGSRVFQPSSARRTF